MIQISKALFPFLLVIGIFASLYFLTLSNAYFQNTDLLSNAIGIDLVITIPLIYYLSIRKTRIPIISVIPVFLISMYIGSVLLKDEKDGIFYIVNNYKIYVAELLFVLFESHMIWKIRKNYKKTKGNYINFKEDLYEACYAYYGNKIISNVVASEFCIFYYLFSKRSTQVMPNSFTYHKKSGKLMTILFCTIILTESIGSHLLIQKWTLIGAWVVTFSSVYLIFFLIAHYKASACSPLTVDKNGIHINNGFIYSHFIPFKEIKSINETTFSSNLKDKKVLYINAMGQLGSINLILNLDHPLETKGIYGIKKQFDTIALEIDERKKLVELLKRHIL